MKWSSNYSDLEVEQKRESQRLRTKKLTWSREWTKQTMDLIIFLSLTKII